MKQKILIPILCLMPFLIHLSAGCLRMEQSVTDKQYFMLDISGQESATTDAGRGPTLMVRNFSVSPPYDGKAFVYRMSSLKYESDYYNAFFISPGIMLTEQIRRGLQKSSLFTVVVNSGSMTQPLYILEGNVSAFYGDYTEKTEPKAILEMAFILFRNGSPRPTIVIQKAYREAVILKKGGPEELVACWGKALERILTALEKDLMDWGVIDTDLKTK
jgi:cholesterol transport system auxiliary component